MALQVASSSSSPNFTSKTKHRYDVFLSFRGEDTRHTFVVPLYNALWRKGINAFIDDKKLGKGEEISPTLLKAIERSRISIIVFSKNYATSTWCLEELTHIIWCRNQKKQLIMSIFYKVDPLDVQYQRNSFQEAMTALEVRFKDDVDKVRKWRSALAEAASLSSAWLFNDGMEVKFIERVVEDAFTMLPPKRFHNTDYMVGLEPRVEEVMSLLNKSDDRVCMLGIHGTGGIGKTTLAKAIYNLIFYQFQGVCFLFDIKEASQKYKGVVRLQKTLLSEILQEKRMKFGCVDEGISIIKHRLAHKKVLLVLDDVDEVGQLEKLAGESNWFGCGSKIIITTRNKQLLIARNVKQTYEMKGLNEHYSLELFCWHAFRMTQPPKGYTYMSIHVIRNVNGLPLALKLIGSNLAHESIEGWRDKLKKYDKIPEGTTYHVLKTSYDSLQDGAKWIFLDIACFFKWKNFEFAAAILEACDCAARFYIEVLVDKSLITIDDNGYLYMHDLIQQMGREIVRQEEPSNPGKRSRLWYYKDVLKVLHENLGGNNIEGIILNPPHQEEVKCSALVFENMNNLKIIIVRNTKFLTYPEYLPNSLILIDWQGYPSMNLPPHFSPPKLVSLKIYRSPFSLEEPFQKFEYLTYLDLSECEFITEVPDMSQFQNLITLSIRQCHSLIKVHDSVGSLSKLETLDFSECSKLTTFLHEINMASLVQLDLSHCKSLPYLPHIVGKMEYLMQIVAEDTAIKELPSSIGNNAPRLDRLVLSSCANLRELPNSLLKLEYLEELELAGIHPSGRKSFVKLMRQSQAFDSCSILKHLDLDNCGLLDEDLLLIFTCFKDIQTLCLARNDFVSLPECIEECGYLEKLDLTDCKRLRDVPELPSTLQGMNFNNCTSLTTESIGRLWSQAKRDLSAAISMPAAATFPDWFDYCCEGDTLGFGVRGKNFPRVVIVAFEVGKTKTSDIEPYFKAFMSINGRNRMMPWVSEFDVDHEGLVLGFYGRQGHVFLSDLLCDFYEQQLKELDKVLELDWNDVEIQVMCESPHLSIIKCGAYVDKQQTKMENIQFKSPLLSRTSLKRKAITSPNEPPKKVREKVQDY